MRKLFEEGVALSQAGKHDEAIEKFNQAAETLPNCNDCYNNVGFSYTQKKEWDKAEAAYKKSLELYWNQGALHGLELLVKAREVKPTHIPQ